MRCRKNARLTIFFPPQGKQVLLSKIEQENLDAHQQLEVELQQLKQAKRSAKAAQQVRP